MLTTVPLGAPVDIGSSVDSSINMTLTRDHLLTDLDSDGALDIVLWKFHPVDGGLGHGFHHYISWRINNGDGSFRGEIVDPMDPPEELRTISGLFLADLDGDGDDDIVVQSPGAWYWRENQFSDGGGFGQSTVLDVGFRRIVGEPLDIDGDRLDDFVTETGWAQNLGNGSFRSHPIEAMRDNRSLVATDLDRDGDVDLITASIDRVTVAWNEGTPALFDTTTSWQTAGSIQLLTLDDIRRIGQTELVVITNAFVNAGGQLVPAQLGVLENLETAPALRVLLERTSLLQNWPQGQLFPVVYDGYHTNVYRDNAGQFGLFLDGFEWQAVDMGELRFFSTGDIDGDRQTDWLGTSLQNEIRWANGVGEGAFSRVVAPAASPLPENLQTIDFDGDGDVDLLFEVLGGLWWRENNGDGFFQRETAIVSQGVNFQVVDVSGDALPDVAYQRTSVSTETIWRENEGGHLDEEVILPATIVRFVDADADGDLDFFLRRPGGTYAIQFNQDGNAVGEPIAIPYFSETHDFDRDGDLDLLIHTDSQLSWAENLGEFNYAAPTLIATGEPVLLDQTLAVDLDQDGDRDLVVIYAQTRLGQATGQIFENDQGFTLVGEFAAEALNHHDVSIVDLDADGDLDFVSGAVRGQYFVENLGEFRFAEKQELSNTHGLKSRAVADLDGNGFLDLVGIDNQSQHIVWLRNELDSRSRVPTAMDIDLLFEAVRNQVVVPEYDWNGDEQVDTRDVDFLFDVVLQTSRADFDLDGIASFHDFLTLSRSFGKSDVRWSDGDADGDGVVGFSDFLLLSIAFGN